MLLMRTAQRREGKKSDSSHFSVEGDRKMAAGYYVAVDIGTTTLSVEIYNAQGFLAGGETEENAQRELGSDVMMRLMHVQQGRGKKLTDLIRNQLYRLLGKLQKELRTRGSESNTADDVFEFRKMTVVGNTVMCHLFLGLDASGLCGAPFQTAYQGSYHTRGGEMGWTEYSDMDILVLPGIAAHVGADAAAVMGTQRLWQSDRIQLAIDLGTNAEILWNDYGKVYACSTAAGPAFEGAGIACGSIARPGVISAVQMMRSSGNMVLDIIPDSQMRMLPPIGICGSGVIDLIAGLRQCGMIQSDGRMLTQAEALSQGISCGLAERLWQDSTGQQNFVIFDPECDKIVANSAATVVQSPTVQVANSKAMQLDICKKVYLTQEDVRAFQLAKAAIQAGIAVLCQETGRTVSELAECQIAGMFGGSLSLKNAVFCGLIPDLPEDRISFIGNAAGRGAAEALFHEDYVHELEQRAGEVKHIELAQNEGFQSLYLQGMAL